MLAIKWSWQKHPVQTIFFSVCAVASCVGVATAVACAVWLKVIGLIQPPCPPAMLGEKLIASYHYPDGAISCRYAAFGVETFKPQRELKGLRK